MTESRENSAQLAAPTDEKSPPESGDIPALDGAHLLENLHRQETDHNFFSGFYEPQAATKTPAPRIPLEPRYLSAVEIERLMQTPAYRTWHHPEAEKVRATVSKWFEITYPGPLNLDSAGRMIRTADKARPATAPAVLTELGPLSLQHAQRRPPRKPSNTLQNRHQRYAQMMAEKMRRWGNHSAE